MRLSFLFITLLFSTACSTTPEVSTTTEKESHSKILANQTDAQLAQDEYKRLQEQRNKE